MAEEQVHVSNIKEALTLAGQYAVAIKLETAEAMAAEAAMRSALVGTLGTRVTTHAKMTAHELAQELQDYVSELRAAASRTVPTLFELRMAIASGAVSNKKDWMARTARGILAKLGQKETQEQLDEELLLVLGQLSSHDRFTITKHLHENWQKGRQHGLAEAHVKVLEPKE